MPNRFKKMIVFSAFSLLILCPSTSFAWHDYAEYGGWDYYGSGRDHPYSQYIDRHNYIGYADYSSFEPDYIDASSYTLSEPAIIGPAQPDVFTVNIPNEHGGYTAVIIKRSANGFVGPQGEFYPEFPKVSQLKIMYGKFEQPRQ
jgi:hypothetical protein